MKLTALRATKTPVLRTKDPPNNQNTPATRTKNSRKGYNFRGGAPIRFLLNGLGSV